MLLKNFLIGLRGLINFSGSNSDFQTLDKFDEESIIKIRR